MSELNTPGPWRIERQPFAFEIVSASREMSASVARIHARAGSKTCEADARLIAAAPEMLKVLLQIEAEMRAGLGSSYGETREQVRRVIRTAIGATP